MVITRAVSRRLARVDCRSKTRRPHRWLSTSRGFPQHESGVGASRLKASNVDDHLRVASFMGRRSSRGQLCEPLVACWLSEESLPVALLVCNGFLAVCTVCNLCRPPGTYVHVAFYIKVRGKRASGVRLASRRGVSRHFPAVRDRRDNQLRNASLSHCVATL